MRLHWAWLLLVLAGPAAMAASSPVEIPVNNERLVNAPPAATRAANAPAARPGEAPAARPDKDKPQGAEPAQGTPGKPASDDNAAEEDPQQALDDYGAVKPAFGFPIVSSGVPVSIDIAGGQHGPAAGHTARDQPLTTRQLPILGETDAPARTSLGALQAPRIVGGVFAPLPRPQPARRPDAQPDQQAAKQQKPQEKQQENQPEKPLASATPPAVPDRVAAAPLAGFAPLDRAPRRPRQAAPVIVDPLATP